MKPKSLKQILILTSCSLLGVLVSGCASGVQRSANYGSLNPMVFSGNKITKISVESTEELKKTASLKFDVDMLNRTIRRALELEDIFRERSVERNFELIVNVTKVRVRSTFNAVMWGAMAGNDKIEGMVSLIDSSGAVVDKFEVSASYALGGFAGGQDGTRMEWLYEAFAKEIVNQFKGGK